MKTGNLTALTAVLTLTATTAFGGECCGKSAGYGSGYGAVAPGYSGYGGGWTGAAGYGVTGYGVPGYGVPGYNPAVYGASPYGQPGGYDNRIGSPYHYTDGVAEQGYGGDVYTNHFGPGFHRNGQSGHYRFPYYSYRRPWYHPGPPAYGADTNLAW